MNENTDDGFGTVFYPVEDGGFTKESFYAASAVSFFLMKSRLPDPALFPGEDGSAQLVWQRGGNRVTIEIVNRDTAITGRVLNQSTRSREEFSWENLGEMLTELRPFLKKFIISKGGMFSHHKEAKKIIDVESGRAERLLELQQLEKGWLDGAGEVISPVSVAMARDVMEDMAAAGLPGVFPMEDGSVQLEWMLLDLDESWEVVISGTDIVEVSWIEIGTAGCFHVDDAVMDEQVVHVSEVVEYFKEREATRTPLMTS